MIGEPPEAKKLHPRAWIIAAREHFEAVGILLEGSPGYLVTKHKRSILILLGFGYECLLKGFTVEQNGNPTWGHDLTKLFAALNPEQRDRFKRAEEWLTAQFQDSLSILDSEEIDDQSPTQEKPPWPARLSAPRHTFEIGLQNLTRWGITFPAENGVKVGPIARYPENATYQPGEAFDLDCFCMCNIGWFVCERWLAGDRNSVRNAPVEP